MLIEDTLAGPVFRDPAKREMRELRKYSSQQVVEGNGVMRGIYSCERRWFEFWADPNRTHEMHAIDHRQREQRVDHLYWLYWYVREGYLYPLPYELGRGENAAIIRKMMRQPWAQQSGLHLPPIGWSEPRSRGERPYRV